VGRLSQEAAALLTTKRPWAMHRAGNGRVRPACGRPFQRSEAGDRVALAPVTRELFAPAIPRRPAREADADHVGDSGSEPETAYGNGGQERRPKILRVGPLEAVPAARQGP